MRGERREGRGESGEERGEREEKICQSSGDRNWSSFPSYPYEYFLPASRLSFCQGQRLLSRAHGHAGVGGWPTARTMPGGKWGSLKEVSPASHSFSWISFTVLRTGWRKIMQFSNCLVGLLPPFFGVQPADYVDTAWRRARARDTEKRVLCQSFSSFSWSWHGSCDSSHSSTITRGSEII